MTTEILRSMLYRGGEIMREVAWVICDEIHYMRDKERGVVWEESIILLPHKVRFVFLSATIPNAREFVGWIARLHHQACHVVYTDYRPTPLEHYIFPAGGDGLHLVVDAKGTFREKDFQHAMARLVALTKDEQIAGVAVPGLDGAPTDVLGAASARGWRRRGGQRRARGEEEGAVEGRRQGRTNDLKRIVKLIMGRPTTPSSSSASRSAVRTYAMALAKDEDFNDDEEKEVLEQVFNNAIDSLGDDKQLPQVQNILPS